MVELSNLSAGPSRPRAVSRTFSSMSRTSANYGFATAKRGYASDHGKKELYSDETGSTGAGVSSLPLVFAHRNCYTRHGN
jgi:hypothetical protein